MKHLLNNLSEEEKNAIREQHTGGMKVMTENFKRLLNAKQGDVKTYLNESEPGLEPVETGEESAVVVYFDEGQTTIKNTGDMDSLVDYISTLIKPFLPTIQKFHKNPNIQLPKFIELYVGTSSTGSPDANRKVAQGRMATLNDVCLKAFEKLGVRADVAYKLMVQNYQDYTPSRIDSEFYDTSKAKPIAAERDCFIVVNELETRGLNYPAIGQLQGKLIDASSLINTLLVDNVDEEKIEYVISKLETYSDIKDLNTALINARMGSLESFLNDQLMDDSENLKRIVQLLNMASRRSGKGDIAKMVGGKISIMI